MKACEPHTDVNFGGVQETRGFTHGFVALREWHGTKQNSQNNQTEPNRTTIVGSYRGPQEIWRGTLEMGME